MREPSAKCRVDESQVLLRSDEMPELTTDEKRENKVLHVDERSEENESECRCVRGEIQIVGMRE